MNERILAIEAALEILWTARIAAHRKNDLGHELLCNAQRHLNAELRAMVQDEDRCPHCGAGIGQPCHRTCRTQTVRTWELSKIGIGGAR